MTPEPRPLTSRQLQWLYSLSRQKKKYHPTNLCEQNTALYESTRARGRQNIHVTEHHWGVSHQPDCEEPDNHSSAFKTSPFIPFIKEMPGQRVKQLLQPWRWQEEGQKADWARLLTKHLSLLVLTPSLNTHQLLLLVAFHTHNLSWPLYTCLPVSKIRGGPETKPCCASVMQSTPPSPPSHSLAT